MIKRRRLQIKYWEIGLTLKGTYRSAWRSVGQIPVFMLYNSVTVKCRSTKYWSEVSRNGYHESQPGYSSEDRLVH